MQSFAQDFRYGLRLLLKHPGVSLIAVLTLALGIGLNGTVFSIVNMLLFRKLPLNLIEQPDRLVFLWSNNQEKAVMKRPASVDGLADWRQQAGSFSGIFGGYRANLNLTGIQEPVRVDAFRTTSSFFSVLQVRPVLGRPFLPEEDAPGGERVAILTYRTWQRLFGGDPQILTRRISLDGVVYKVVGIMPRDFYMPSPEVELFTPLGIGAGQRSRDERTLMAVARLAPNVSLQKAQAEMDGISQRLAEAYPDTERGWQVQVKPLLEELFDGGVIASAVILLVAVGLVLLLVCGNVGGLLLARATARSREVSVRIALGASRWRLVRQLLTESLLLALLGTALGLLLALWGARLIGSISSNATLQLTREVGVDVNMMIFLTLAALFSTLSFGLFPALAGSRPDLTENLKEGGDKASASRRSRRALNAIVVVEMALSLTLLVGAGLMLRTLRAWQDLDQGYDSRNLLTFRLQLSEARFDEPQIRSFVGRLAERVAALPGARNASVANRFPADPDKASRSFLIEGRVGEEREQPWGFFITATPDYLETLGVRLLEGRYLTKQDSEAAPLAVVVGKELAARYWPGQSPLGKRLRLVSEGQDAPWFTIVGVVGDVLQYNVNIEPVPILYFSLAQRPERDLAVVVRTGDDPLRLAPDARRALREIDPEQPAYAVQTMEQVSHENYTALSLMTRLLGFFGLFSLVLAGIGLYGVISYSVNQRVQEIGVRVALGARQGSVLWMILSHAGRLALLGIAFGLLGAFGLTRLMSSMLYGVSSTDPPTFAGVSLLLLAIALLASFFPGRRAARVDPVVALRYE